MSHVHAFLMHTYSLFIFDIFELHRTFSDCSSLLLPLNLFTLVVSMAPKRKSTLTQNPLHTDPSTVRFRDDDAFKAFSENFSR